MLAIGGKKSQPIYQVTAQGLLDLRCTSEHPFYVREMKRVYTPIGRTTVRKFSDPLWKAAKDLQKDDFIGYNILDSNSNPHKITMEEAFIIGRYIADGHTAKNYRTSENRPNHRQWQVILSIGEDKLNDFKQNIKENNFSCYSHSTSVYRVVFSSKRLVQIVEANCGCGAANKHLSKMLLDLPLPLLEQVINGYISGDGYKLSEFKYKISTISSNLIYNCH